MKDTSNNFNQDKRTARHSYKGHSMMALDNRTESKRKSKDFQKLANQKSPGLAAEFLDFLRHNKKWWLTPIIIFLLFLGIIAVLGGTGAAPFIYTLF